MENYEQNYEKSNFLTQSSLPNSTASLVLGIISIVFSCCCGGFIGIILGVIGLVLSINATKLYANNNDIYTESSYKNANAGKICSIIGLAISLFFIISLILHWETYKTLIESIMDGSFDPSMYYRN